jgi:hypothetical protein
MTLIVETKNKTQEKALKAFLNSLEIGYRTEADEDAALYAAMLNGRKTKLLTKSEKLSFLKSLSAKK